jgi:cytosine/uracil/thiamine/allantoin permease
MRPFQELTTTRGIVSLCSTKDTMASFVKKILKTIELPEEQRTNPWINEDIAPVPQERQTWSK